MPRSKFFAECLGKQDKNIKKFYSHSSFVVVGCCYCYCCSFCTHPCSFSLALLCIFTVCVMFTVSAAFLSILLLLSIYCWPPSLIHLFFIFLLTLYIFATKCSIYFDVGFHFYSSFIFYFYFFFAFFFFSSCSSLSNWLSCWHSRFAFISTTVGKIPFIFPFSRFVSRTLNMYYV